MTWASRGLTWANLRRRSSRLWTKPMMVDISGLRFRIVGPVKLRDGMLKGWIRAPNHPLSPCANPSLLSQSKRSRYKFRITVRR
jgi:hypothetical protein